jgi:hypothetical protein
LGRVASRISPVVPLEALYIYTAFYVTWQITCLQSWDSQSLVSRAGILNHLSPELGFTNVRVSPELGFTNVRLSPEIEFTNVPLSPELGFTNARLSPDMEFTNVRLSPELGFANVL